MEPNYRKPITVKGPHKGFVKGSPYRLEHQAIVEGKIEGNPLNPWSQERSQTFFSVDIQTMGHGFWSKPIRNFSVGEENRWSKEECIFPMVFPSEF